MSERIRLETWECTPGPDQPFSDRLHALAQSDPRIAEYEHAGDFHYLYLNPEWECWGYSDIGGATVEEVLDCLNTAVTKVGDPQPYKQ